MFGATEFGMDTTELVNRAVPTTPLASGTPAGGAVEVKVESAGQAAPVVAAPVQAAQKSFFTTPVIVGLGAVALFFLIRR